MSAEDLNFNEFSMQLAAHARRLRDELQQDLIDWHDKSNAVAAEQFEQGRHRLTEVISATDSILGAASHGKNHDN